jgi:hypothetical protein
LGTLVWIVPGTSFGQVWHPLDWRMDSSVGRAEPRFQILRGSFGQRTSDGILAPAVPAPLKVLLRQKVTFILQPHGGYCNTLNQL